MATVGDNLEHSPRLPRWVTTTALCAWAVALTLTIGSLMTGHWVSLPKPDARDPLLTQGAADLFPADGQWQMVHVLYAECRCSKAIYDHVVMREPCEHQAAANEAILLVGEDPEFCDDAAERGIHVIHTTSEELERRFGITAAPLLLVLDPEGAVRYCGGHTDRKQGTVIRDLELLARCQTGEEVIPLPVFGCGVATSLQETLDPFGLKY